MQFFKHTYYQYHSGCFDPDELLAAPAASAGALPLGRLGWWPNFARWAARYKSCSWGIAKTSKYPLHLKHQNERSENESPTGCSSSCACVNMCLFLYLEQRTCPQLPHNQTSSSLHTAHLVSKENFHLSHAGSVVTWGHSVKGITAKPASGSRSSPSSCRAAMIAALSASIAARLPSNTFSLGPTTKNILRSHNLKSSQSRDDLPFVWFLTVYLHFWLAISIPLKGLQKAFSG